MEYLKSHPSGKLSSHKTNSFSLLPKQCVQKCPFFCNLVGMNKKDYLSESIGYMPFRPQLTPPCKPYLIASLTVL
jgi:hypothetical protein